MSSLLIAKENGNILHSPMCGIGGAQVPQTRALTDSQRDFNKSLSSARVVIEQAFGPLTERWECLLDKLDETVEKSGGHNHHLLYSTQHMPRGERCH